MRRGLEFQVPSLLQRLRFGPLNIIASPLLASSNVPIRRDRRLPIRRSNARSFSSSRLTQSIVRIPIQLQHTPSNTSSDTEGIQTEENTTNKHITSHSFLLMHKQQYGSISSFLLEHKSDVTSDHLEIIMKELEIRNQYECIIDIHKKLPSLSFENEQVIKLLLRISFKFGEYSLFEVVFSRYLELPKQSPKYCNMALKAVMLNRNQEFAKQLLYQMVYSQLPMNLSTFKSFLNSARKSGTFQSIKFAADLLQKNPNIPVDSETFSLLMRCYSQSANEVEMTKFVEFLEERDCDLYEFDLFKFYNEIKKARYIDYNQIWDKINEARESLRDKEKLQREFYFEMLQIFADKLRGKDLFKLMDFIAEDGVQITEEAHSIVLAYFSKSGDVNGLLQLFDSFKAQNHHIQPLFVSALWKTLITHDPDLAEAITVEFQKYAQNTYTKSQLRHPFLKSIKLQKSRRGFAPEVSDSQLLQSINHIKKLLSEKRDSEIIAMINDELRQGLKPDYLLLINALVGLINIRSQDAISLYRLSCQLHSDRIVDFDLAWLRKTIRELKGNLAEINQQGKSLIIDFKMKHQIDMTHKHFNDLANMCIDVFNYDLAIELLKESRISTIEPEKRDNMKIYITILRALTRKRDWQNLLEMMDLISVEENLKITRFCLKHLQTNRQFLNKMNKVEKMEGFENFDKEFWPRYEKVKNRYQDQKKLAWDDCKKSIVFLKEWDKAT